MTPRVYFYCDPREGNLQEDVISLAEGLRDLGIPFSGNCNYWKESPESSGFLIAHDPQIEPDDCTIVVVSYTWPFFIKMGTFETVRRPLPADLFKPGRKYQTVYMDSHDGHRTVSWESEFQQFDVILRSKLNRRAGCPSNLRPWVLGLNNRIINATQDPPPFDQRNKKILWNFGASHPYPHGARDIADKVFKPAITPILPIDSTKDDLSIEPAAPYDALMWRQTGQRFSRSYYDRLKQTQAVACFCGELIPPRPFRNPECYLVGGKIAKIKRQIYELLGHFDPQSKRSVQWDSFRFWESLAAGCAVINIDLEKYGVNLPVMPKNWIHYIGVDLDRPEQTIKRLIENPSLLSNIAAAGKSWAFENYSPRVMARRFLDTINP